MWVLRIPTASAFQSKSCIDRFPSETDAAQGGAQGLEDAAALGELLPKDISKNEINNRLNLFESIRKERCTTMQLNSYFMAKFSPLTRGETSE